MGALKGLESAVAIKNRCEIIRSFADIENVEPCTGPIRVREIAAHGPYRTN